jgi:NADPH-dependent glutamate synthase beta subunit-like oxidoreductase
MPANPEEVQAALEEGIELVELTAPVRFLGNRAGKVVKIECQKMQLASSTKTAAAGRCPWRTRTS